MRLLQCYFSTSKTLTIADVYGGPLEVIRIPKGFAVRIFKPPSRGDFYLKERWFGEPKASVAEEDFPADQPRLVLTRLSSVPKPHRLIYDQCTLEESILSTDTGELIYSGDYSRGLRTVALSAYSPHKNDMYFRLVS